MGVSDAGRRSDGPRSGSAAGRSPEADRVSPPRARRAQLYLQHRARPGRARRAKRGARRVGGDRAPQAAQPPRSAADTLLLGEGPAVRAYNDTYIVYIKSDRRGNERSG